MYRNASRIVDWQGDARRQIGEFGQSQPHFAPFHRASKETYPHVPVLSPLAKVGVIFRDKIVRVRIVKFQI